MQPRLTTQASVAASRATTSSAVRNLGLSGARFWKNGSPSAPFTYRLSTMGRPATPRSAPPATAR